MEVCRTASESSASDGTTVHVNFERLTTDSRGRRVTKGESLAQGCEFSAAHHGPSHLDRTLSGQAILKGRHCQHAKQQVEAFLRIKVQNARAGPNRVGLTRSFRRCAVCEKPATKKFKDKSALIAQVPSCPPLLCYLPELQQLWIEPSFTVMQQMLDTYWCKECNRVLCVNDRHQHPCEKDMEATPCTHDPCSRDLHNHRSNRLSTFYSEARF